MTKEEINSLARAACCWLAYKDLTGFGDMLSEAMLSLPISEFLNSLGGWELSTEVNYRDLCQDRDIPEFYCDFAGKRRGGSDFQFILEAKFLKDKAQNRLRDITADLARLSLPTKKALQRYFLLAGRSVHFPAPGNLALLQGLFDLTLGKAKYIDLSKEVSKAEFVKTFPKFEGVSSLKGTDWRAYVTCRANEPISVKGSNKFKVVVWSVGKVSSHKTMADNVTPGGEE